MKAFRSHTGLMPPTISSAPRTGFMIARSPDNSMLSSNNPTTQEEDLEEEEDLDDLPQHEEMLQKKCSIIVEKEELSQRNKSIELLTTFLPHNNNTSGRADPVLALTMLYQKQGILKTSHCFTTYIQKSKSSLFWASFACPITGVEYTSSGISLFCHHQQQQQRDDDDDDDDLLTELATKIFGSYTIIEKDDDDDQKVVLFATKKGAKRAVAICVLEAHNHNNKVITGVESSDGIIEADASSSPKKQSKSNVPGWVQELRTMGIDTNSLVISYREHFSGRAQQQQPLSPCQLCCILKVQKLKEELTVISLPCASKRAAVESAVLLLSEELKRTQKSSVNKPMSSSQLIYKCDPSSTSYMVKALPSWANAAPNGKLYLYRLRFFTTVGKDFVASRSGLDVLTPLGIVFCSELPAAINENERYRAQFELPTPCRTKQERVIVEISNPTLIDWSSDSQQSVDICLDRMECFNEKVYFWKDYGKPSSSEKPGRQGREPTSLLDRTYMFVPLQKDPASVSIDWDLLRQIAQNERIPYLKRLDQDWGQIDLLFLSALFASLSLAILIPDLMRVLPTLFDEDPTFDLGFLFHGLNGVGTSLACMSLVALLAFVAYPISKPIEKKTLQNRFMVEQKPGERQLHVTPSKDHCVNPFGLIESHLSGRSPVMNPAGNGPSEGAVETNLRKFNLDLRTASFAVLYSKKFGINIRCPRQRLLNGVPVGRHPDQDFLFQSKKERFKYLVPELVKILPMPRDALYMLKQASLFMPALEQAIEFDALTVAMHASLNSLNKSASFKGQVSECQINTELGARLLDEALTVAKYQRLEFLGDAVLGFFLALNLMARNASLMWDNEDLELVFSAACKNKTLYDASLRIGIGALLRTGNKTWTSIFQAKPAASPDPLQEMIQIITCSQQSDYQLVPDKNLSDVVESLLGAVFLAGKSGDSRLVIGLLERLKLPISGQYPIDEENYLPWFQATSPCFGQGYSFELDEAWQAQIRETGTALFLDRELSAKLEHGYQGLVTLLTTLCEDEALPEKLLIQQSKILLMCSLFDDSLNDSEKSNTIKLMSEPEIVSTKSLEPSGTELKGLEHGVIRAALLRDTLNMVGSYALQLCITTDLFHRYPGVNESSLHILRVCAIADDVVVYIMFKAGIDKFLLDREAGAIRKFQSTMEMADVLGKSEWLKRNGWILPGGTSEFASRCRNPRRIDDPLKPQYYGLAGGRLVGRTQKIPESITSDLVFSMKAIIGALVLSIGVEGMWSCIGPLFEEVMLLSIDELRREFKGSSIIR